MTIRQALSTLQKQSLTEKANGKGSFVRFHCLMPEGIASDTSSTLDADTSVWRDTSIHEPDAHEPEILELNHFSVKKASAACLPNSTVSGEDTIRLVQCVLPVQPPRIGKL